MARRRKTFGTSFSWKRASGLSAAKGKLSRQLGIPLTRSGRQRKAGRALGCLVPLAFLILTTITIFAAFAEEIPSMPKQDVDAQCTSMMRRAGRSLQSPGYNNYLNECINQEQFYYNYLKRIWPILPISIQSECIEWPPYVQQPAFKYFNLATCVSKKYEIFLKEHEGPTHFQQ